MDYSILVIDDELEMCLSLSEFLQSKGYAARYTTNPREVAHLLENEKTDLIIMDIKMPEMGGIDLLKVIKKFDPAMPVIMITGYPTVENAVQAMKYGAVNFYTKPLRLSELLQEIHELAAKSLRKQRDPQHVKYNIITQDPEMQEILETIRKASLTTAPVLITGESGTGKELAANSFTISAPGRRILLSRSIARPCPKNCWKANFSAMKKGPLQALSGNAKDASS